MWDGAAFAWAIRGEQVYLLQEGLFLISSPLFFLAWKESHVRTKEAQALKGAKRRQQTLKPKP